MSIRKYWIVNLRTNKYVKTYDELEEDWKKNFPHVANEDWGFVYAYSVWEEDMTANGMYYVYDLCCDGGLFTLLVDVDEHSREDIKQAKHDLRRTHDVVSITILKLKKAGA